VAILAVLVLIGCNSGSAPEAPLPPEPQEEPRSTDTPAPSSEPEGEALPDLVITSASVAMRGYEGPGACMAEYEPLEWTVCVANQGEADAGRFVVEAQVANGPMQQWEVLALAAGEETCLTAEAPGGGDVVIDPEEAIAESDETNNAEHIILPTLTPPPLCTPSADSGPLPDLVMGGEAAGFPDYEGGCVASFDEVDPLVWTFCIRNQGHADAGPFTVEARMADGTIHQWEVEGIPAGEESCIVTEAPGEGDIVIDAGGAVPESDETNNTDPIILPMFALPVLCTPTP
jgi:hypothetical protein